MLLAFLHKVFPQNLDYKPVWDAQKTKTIPAPQLTDWRQTFIINPCFWFTKQLKRCQGPHNYKGSTIDHEVVE